jgi:hypothetical protein
MAEIRLAIRNSALQHCKLQLDQKLLTKGECDEKSMAEIVKVAELVKITKRSVFSELRAHFSHLVPMVEHMFQDNSDDSTGTAGETTASSSSASAFLPFIRSVVRSCLPCLL